MKKDIRDEFLRLIHNEEYLKSEEYLKKNIPKKIYKFIDFLNKSDDVNKENDKKLDSLANNQLWLCKISNLNDPFEYVGCLNDESKDKDLIKMIYDAFKQQLLITSFTENGYDNMPMWSYYANDHRGICIEFEVLDNEKLYPVLYENKKLDITELIKRLIQLSVSNNNEDAANKKTIIKWLYMLALFKHTSWRHEQEYRIVKSSSCDKLDGLSISEDEDGKLNLVDEEGRIISIVNEEGQSISVSELGLKVSTIFIGKNCEYQKRLIDISKKIDCEVRQVTMDDVWII
ncbi:hypothetical protein SH1V18_47570 [Vallitalea longa]|uniref:DUF2971 domain-containing protein n=1 Tax=Vallitalea longa TaxID=2936439 RepID=A0A9W5YEZ7_9FIRM|nr:DUF2971 domain-containing protein [Vallitalea longa]GKX32277.1 hypothetical protein SH1V18_47570 [Vallitalea longa]